MLSSMPRQCLALIVTLISVLLIPLPSARAQDADAKPEGLVPCLAVLADQSPIYPNTVFAPSKRLTVAFRLPKDSSAKMLNSRWVAAGGDEKVLATNDLDLKGQKSGWLRLELKEPAQPGKYRVEAALDGKPWKSIDIEITPPIEEGKAQNPAELLPIADGTTMSYDVKIRPAKGVKMTVPEMEADAEGVIRGNITMSYSETGEAGTHYIGTIGGQTVADMWVKLTDKGLCALKRKEGDQFKEINPPLVLQPLPPSLADGIEWGSPAEGGGVQALVCFGPLKLEGPDGPTTGYIIYGEHQDNPGASGAAAGDVETLERHYIPKVGLVREVRVNLHDGKLASRQEFKLGPGMYTMVPNQMKGRLGRVEFKYPPETQSSGAKVAIFKGGVKPDEDAMVNGYGEAGYDLMPGKYEASISAKRVPIVVKSGHTTTPRCGVLRIHAGKDTHFRVLDSDKKTELIGGYGEQDIALPPGTYVLEISGASEAVIVTDGKVTEF